MSIAHAKKIITIPAFQYLPTDVTPIIVQSMRSPSIRSLAQTSKGWNVYLKKIWDLDQRNYSYAVRQINGDLMPLVRTLDMAENLYREVSKRKAGKFVDSIFSDLGITDPRRTNVRTLLSGRTGKVIPGSLQEALASHEGWDAGSQIDEKKIEQLVLSCFSPINAERTLLKDVMKACTMLPDKFKTVAFVALISELCNRQGFNDDDGAFWRNKGRRSVFQTLLPGLLPTTWSPCLTSSGNTFGLNKTIMYDRSSFGMAVEACLRKFGSSVPELSFAILRLVKASAKDLIPEKQNWDGVSKHLLKQNLYIERRLIKHLMYAVFLWGVVDDEKVNQACKKMLCDSSFLTKLQWSSLKSDAWRWYLLTAR